MSFFKIICLSLFASLANAEYYDLQIIDVQNSPAHYGLPFDKELVYVVISKDKNGNECASGVDGNYTTVSTTPVNCKTLTRFDYPISLSYEFNGFAETENGLLVSHVYADEISEDRYDYIIYDMIHGGAQIMHIGQKEKIK